MASRAALACLVRSTICCCLAHTLLTALVPHVMLHGSYMPLLCFSSAQLSRAAGQKLCAHPSQPPDQGCQIQI